MSRMDVLEDHELEDLIEGSDLIPKYNKEIDRESAYEMLNEKIDVAEKAETKAKAKKEAEAVKRTSSRSSGRRRSTRQNPVVKVLTSPTVIRSVLGILGKLMR